MLGLQDGVGPCVNVSGTWASSDTRLTQKGSLNVLRIAD